MLFDKFVPAYHHHFGHQCKVSDYGFTKLIELFEAIPDTVKIEDSLDEERKVSLILPKALKVVGNQIRDLIKKTNLGSIPLELLLATYLREYGYSLKPRYYECIDVKDLIVKLNEFVHVVYTNAGPFVVLVDTELQNDLVMRTWAILLQEPYCLNLSIFKNRYKYRYYCNITISKLEKMTHVVKVQFQLII